MNRRSIWIFCIPALLAVAFGPVTAPRIAESWDSRLLVAAVERTETPPASVSYATAQDSGGWQWGTSPRSSQRDEHVMGYDAGMLRASLVGTTWSTDDGGEALLDSLRRGPIRHGTDSFDAKQIVVVLFNADGTSTETRTFDGQSWTLHRVPGPPPRSLPARVYDPARKTVVLFTAGYIGSSLAHAGDARIPIER